MLDDDRVTLTEASPHLRMSRQGLYYLRDTDPTFPTHAQLAPGRTLYRFGDLRDYNDTRQNRREERTT